MEAATSRIRTATALLVSGIVAGPLYLAVGLIQLVIRPGFDTGTTVIRPFAAMWRRFTQLFSEVASASVATAA